MGHEFYRLILWLHVEIVCNKFDLQHLKWSCAPPAMGAPDLAFTPDAQRLPDDSGGRSGARQAWVGAGAWVPG